MRIFIVLLMVVFLSSCDSIRASEKEAIEIAKEYAVNNVPIEGHDINNYYVWVYFSEDDYSWQVKFAHEVHAKDMINDDGSIEAVSPGCPFSFGISVNQLFGRVKNVYHC